jgi:hypothetical protein
MLVGDRSPIKNAVRHVRHIRIIFAITLIMPNELMHNVLIRK